jgi:hypothetical protein
LVSGREKKKGSDEYSISWKFIIKQPVMRNSIKTVFFAILLSVSIASAEKADYLIIDNPKAFSVLDKYEQKLGPETGRPIVAYVPFKIIRENQTLGDQITSALKVQVFDNTYFFLTDDKNELLGGKGSLYKQRFKGCEVLGDTVTVIKGNAVTISAEYPAKGKQTGMQKGDVLIRIFSYQNSFCVQRMGAKPLYGWCPASAALVWEALKNTAPAKDTGIRPIVISRIQSHIDVVNRKYRQSFDYFNKVTGQDKSAPAWNMSAAGSSIKCTMSGGYNYASLLEESTKYLVSDLRSILIGEQLDVSYQNSEIIIQPKQTDK